jgi:hypothetical protein
MRIAPLLTAVTCLAACTPVRDPSTASPALADGAAVGALAGTLTNLCTGPASVPMEIAGSREFVSVTLPGSKVAESLRFHVDTGGNTPGLMIYRSAVERLGFTEATLPRTIHIGDRDIAIPDGAKWVTVDDAGAESKFDHAARKHFAVGQIGAGFLSRFVVCIDPGNARLGLGDPKEFNLEPGDAKWVPLLMMSGGDNHALYPFVHVLLLDKGAFAGGYGLLLDTGATTSMLDRNKVESQIKTHKDWPTVRGAFGDADMLGGGWPEEIISVSDVALNTPGDLAWYGLKERVTIDLGPATFVERPTGTWDKMFGSVRETLGSHGAIANDVLLGYRLVLDYPHARIFAQASKRPRPASASPVRVGVAIRFESDGCPTIRQITDTNAPDTRSKLQVGDTILTIDGKDACKMWHHEIQAALAGPPGEIKKLHLRRSAQTMDVDVATADLFSMQPGVTQTKGNASLTPSESALATSPEEIEAQHAAESWLAGVDAGKYADSWTDASTRFRAHLEQPAWVAKLTEVRTPLGATKSRRLQSVRFTTNVGGDAPTGEYVVLKFDTVFENKGAFTETVTPMKDADGKWHVTGYFVRH